MLVKRYLAFEFGIFRPCFKQLASYKDAISILNPTN